MRKILILGAGQYQVKVIEHLKELGFYVAAVDANENAAGRLAAHAFETVGIEDAAGIRDWAADIKAEAIIPLNDVGVRSAAFAAAALGLRGLSPDVAELANNKLKMRQCWAAAGLAQPRFAQVYNQDDCRRAVAEFGFPLIIKPADCGGGSRGVVKINTVEEVDTAFRQAAEYTRFSPDLILEEFISGTELTVEGLVCQSGPHILAVSDKNHFKSNHYCVASSLNYYAALDPVQDAAVHRLTNQAVISLGLENCLFHLEMIINEDGYYLVELGARGGGGHIFSTIVPWVSGIDYAGQYARMLLGEQPELQQIQRRGAVYRFLSALPGKIISMGDVEKLRGCEGVADISLPLKVGDRVNEFMRDTDRFGYVVTLGKNRRAALALADGIEMVLAIKTEEIY